MKEIWKDIPNYEGLYQVSNLGNVKSLCYGARNIRKSNVHKILKHSPNNWGYHKVQLYKDGKSQMLYIHRLVASLFIPNPENKEQVNHIDGNKANNKVSNLEWATSKENLHHAEKLGLRSNVSPMLGKKGILNPTSKCVNQYDKNGRYLATYYGVSEAARHVGVVSSSISACANGRHKTCAGYIWKFPT